MFISELKAENFELKHRQTHYYDIRDRIASTEHDINIVNDERRRLEDEMRLRKAEDDDSIRRIQIDNDGIRGTIAGKEHEIAELKAHIEALRKEDDDATHGIRSITTDITAIGNQNVDLRNDGHKLEGQIADERALGRQLRADLDRAIGANANLEHNIKFLEDDLRKNKIQEDELARLLAAKTAEFDDKQLKLRALEDEVAKLRSGIDKADFDLGDLTRKYNMQLDLTNKERAELDKNLIANSDLDNTVRRLEDELAHLEKDIGIMRGDVDRLRIAFDEATITNKGLEEELNALTKHAQLLEGQNVDLTKELDAIVVADERIRNDLDRRHRVVTLQQRNDDEMRQSINRLRYTRRSPSPYSRSPVASPIRYEFRG